MTRTYSELIQIDDFDKRFDYARIGGGIGRETFGWDRYLNQTLYKSPEWRRFRQRVIVRDCGCDLAFPDRTIGGIILIHHLNPITKEDILNRAPCLFDFENVVCVSRLTHNALHYGDDSYLELYRMIERKPNDTCPWKGV